MRAEIRSWGNVCGGEHDVTDLHWRDEAAESLKTPSVLAFGNGRSYGDSCLNAGGTLLRARGLDRFLSWDPTSGVLDCEAGVTLDEILRFSVPRGFFLPVSLGTKLITVGGAVANDVHGKNHHRAGTFGRHVRSLTLLRSSGERLRCSPEENAGMFSATVGGLGLTGLILSAEITLPRVPGSFLDVESVQFGGLDEYFDLARESDGSFEHTSAWVDFSPRGRRFGRGVFLRGNFSATDPRKKFHRVPVNVPFFAPSWLLNRPALRVFNWMYYERLSSQRESLRAHYDPFFFPLDAMGEWKRLYGRRGFFQYQFVVPHGKDRAAMEEVAGLLKSSRGRPYLAVLKSFGGLVSPGLLSFPLEGLTVALDFPNLGARTRAVFDDLDGIVRSHGGRLYPAKDARMSPEMFSIGYPGWRELERLRDPAFHSDFWRRVTGVNHG